MEELSNDDTRNEADGPLKLSRGQRRAVTACVLLGMFIAALEATVVGTAMPTVVAALGGLSQYSWVFSIYLLTSTTSMPVWGKLSDLYGLRPLYQGGIGVFLLGSVLSGLSDSMTQLIIFRAVQGLGAGALVPIGLTIIGSIYSIQGRARVQALFSGVWGFASLAGPLAGGLITDHLSWRLIFFLSLPFGIVAAIIIGLGLKEPPRTERPVIDYAGAVVLTTAITLLMLALVQEENTVTTTFRFRHLLLLAAAACLIMLFIRIERRVVEPLVPLSLFRNRAVTVSVVVGFTAGVALYGIISFAPLFARVVLGATATEAGSLLTPMMVGWVAFSFISSRLLLRVGYRSTVMAGLGLLFTGVVVFSLFGTKTSRLWVMADLGTIGAGVGLTMMALLMLVQQNVPRTQLGTATSLYLFSRAIGGAVGVAMMGTILSLGFAASLKEVAQNQGTTELTLTQATALVVNPNALPNDLPNDLNETGGGRPFAVAAQKTLREAFTRALRNVFWFAAAFAGLALLVVLVLPTHRESPEASVVSDTC